MKEYFTSGKELTFDTDVLRIYLETTLSQNQYLLHQLNSSNLAFYSEDQNWSYAKKSEKKSYDIEMRIVFDTSVPFDGYILDIKEEKIFVTVSQYRGVIFAINNLEELYKEHTLPLVKIIDYPTIEYRGIIEGFYGIPWTHSNRLDMLDFLINHRFNTYFYAPKDDVYHREKWRMEYPKQEQLQLLELINKANNNHIDFIYAISPGKDIDLCNEEDILEVSNKLLQIHRLGVTKFALLMDDIDYTLNEQQKNMYQTPGIAHSILANKVYEQLQKHLVKFDFYICPTEYWQNWDTPYRQDMKTYLHKGIDTFFTGYHTIAQSIPKEDLDIAYDSFGHKLAIWDNYPTNDVNKDRLYLDALRNRTSQLTSEQVSCYVSNPMNQYNLSKFALLSFSDYLWSPATYNSEQSLEAAILLLSKQWNISKESLKLFVYLNQSTRLREQNYKKVKEVIKNGNKEELTTLLSSFERCLESISSLPQEVLTEVTPWSNKLSEEIMYLRAYIEQTQCTIKENSYNLGFNFGTYALHFRGNQHE